MNIQWNIRQKIALGFVVLILSLGLLTSFSYSNLKLLEKKTYSLEFIDDIQNGILEFRRQEKNYLLFNKQSSYMLALTEVDAVLAMVDKTDAFEFAPKLENTITQLRETILLYRSQMISMHDVARHEGRAFDTEVDKLRDIGKDLIMLARVMSNAEREAILKINKHLRSQLFTAITGVMILLVVILYVVITRILRPLKIIEMTTTQIAEGNFQILEVRKTNDEIRKVQEAFNRMVRELEKRQDQLVQAQKLSSIGTLSAGIAHQVNNPLNNISTSAQILRDSVAEHVDEFGLRMLHNIDTETERARDIVRGLLEFARHTELSMQRVCLNKVVANAIRLVSSQVPPGVQVEHTVPDTIFVEIDPQRMGEVLLNLLLNAIHAIEDTPGTISVYMDDEPAQDMLTLTVEDNGKGISPEHISHIFDPFFTSKEVGKGTGLGLSVAYGIIEEFNGRIRVESTVGVGTRFYIDLPRLDDDAASAGSSGDAGAEGSA